MTFKSFIDSPCGLRYMLDTLQLQTVFSKKILLNTQMFVNGDEINDIYAQIDDLKQVAGNNILSNLLCSLKDIEPTLLRLGDNAVLDEIELFEIKYFAFKTGDIRNFILENKLTKIVIPTLDTVLDILDPDKLRVPSFHIYSSYSVDLKRARDEFRFVQFEIEKVGRLVSDTASASDDLLKKLDNLRDRDGELVDLMNKIEAQVRSDLSGRLLLYFKDLILAYKEISSLDIACAKALQIKQMNLCIPSISLDSRTKLTKMFHPKVAALLEKKNKVFEAIDISFASEAICIIGANMGGKTVVLKSVGLCQLLFQFGFGVPAKEAVIDIKDNVLFCIGDDQNLEQGLSSFAAEMLGVDEIIKSVKQGNNILALIDEPARTTNPIEGAALVSALLNILCGKNLSLLLTTHYNVDGEAIKRLRVRGLIDGKMNYTLEEIKEGDVPHEALQIALSLDVDKEWINEAKEVLFRKNLNNKY